MKEAVWLRLYVLVAVIVLFPLYILALLLCLVRIKGWDLRKFFPGKNGLVTFSNHVTNVETVLIPLLLAPFLLFWLRLVIFSVAKKKWYGKWWFVLARPAAIPVSPGDGIGAEESMKETISFLKKGKKISHMYPSGTRLKRTKEAKKEVKTLGKREIGRFHPGILAVISETKSDLLHMWVDSGRWPLITITIGKRIPFSSLDFPDKKFSELTEKEKEELLVRLEDILLET